MAQTTHLQPIWPHRAMVSLKAWLSLGEKDGEVLLGRSARGVPSPLWEGQEPTGSQKLNKWISMGQKKGRRALWTRHLPLDCGSQCGLVGKNGF